MSTKLIENLDEDTWRRFAGYCKAKGVMIGNQLTDVLKEYLEDKLK